MNSAEIRSLFLAYFEERGHTRQASASLVPSSYDPSVLLTTAGMQPFKPYFLGQEQPPAQRLTSCQKCFRTPDIDQVGLTARHLTFFEMLGNFSFGDYFKQGAIEMAWELVTRRLGLDADRLWATVHRGDESLELGLDEEAVELWVAQGLPRERIVPLGEDNFWKAGPTGPCGPCSELYYDRGPAYQDGCPDHAACKPGCDCDRYLEFYNLVFMQYDRDDAGRLSPLPSQNIDTGMGLERVSSLIQDVPSVFDTDSMRAIIEWGERASGRTYGEDPAATRALRVLCDHGRGMSFLASDGVVPSNEGRGYVLRRIIRRAIQQADRIGLYADADGGVLEQLHSTVVAEFAGAYPALEQQRDVVRELLVAEERRFLATLSKGTAMLGEVIDGARSSGVVSGDDAFQLHDTFGFPWELTDELAREQGLTVDRPRFEELMREQRERARAAAGGGSLPVDAAAAFVRAAPAAQFTGYTSLHERTSVLALQPVEDEAGERLLVKLARSPFYAEGGGQVGDAGTITGPRGRALVEAVMRFEDDQVIVARMVDGELAEGEEVDAEVDQQQRWATQANHTATHLLHKALRDQLGDHVRQAGSLVAPDRLRFDFTHPAALSADEVAAIEAEVNEHVARAEQVRWQQMPIAEARDAGAMMLFGEKYGDVVRMVEVGDGWSRELCGGTHVANTSEIRQFLVVHEGSVGSNTRRIEALTGQRAVAWLRERATRAESAAAAANVEVERLPDRVRELVEQNRRLERELSALRSGSVLDDAIGAAVDVDGIHVVTFRADELVGDELLDLADRLKGRLEPAAVLLGSAHGGKAHLVASVSDRAVQAGLRAGDVIREVAGIVDGGGGGRPTMARAGGKDPSRLDEALARGGTIMREAVAGAATGS